MLNLDTHILIFAMQGEISARERKLLANNPWTISDIVLWEITKLIELGRLSMSLDDSEVLATLSQLQVFPISLDVCRATLELDFSGDPADELIAATSIFHRIPLLTRDRAILRSKVVPFAL